MIASTVGALLVATAIVAAQPANASGITPACPAASSGQARCLAEFAPAATTGYGAADLRAAYNLPASGGTGTVAIVDAYGYPSAEADLATYRDRYGLPACTVASGCLRIVNQDGAASPLPDPDPNWSVETALDLDMASAACPGCTLLLVQANDPAIDNLSAAVDTAVAKGAAVVSNSYGMDEFDGMASYAAHYTHAGVPILASSGDRGFTIAQFPAVLSSVIAVGGTTLTRDDSARGWSEAAWSGAGSGCSAYQAKPSWQWDANCSLRTVGDVSAVADPDTGVAVYDSYQKDGWLVVGGTSAAAPFVAGVIALAGDPSAVTPATLYAHSAAFYDAVGGSNGYCGGDYLCTGVSGYDAPTGLGTPNGVAGFQ